MWSMLFFEASYTLWRKYNDAKYIHESVRFSRELIVL